MVTSRFSHNRDVDNGPVSDHLLLLLGPFEFGGLNCLWQHVAVESNTSILGLVDLEANACLQSFVEQLAGDEPIVKIGNVNAGFVFQVRHRLCQSLLACQNLKIANGFERDRSKSNSQDTSTF